MVQWLRLHSSNAGGIGLIPGQGTEILQAIQCGQNIYMFVTFFFGCTLRHTESLFPDQGSDPYPLHWKHGVLTLDHQGDPCIYSTSQLT